MENKELFTPEWRVEMVEKYPFLQCYDIYGSGKELPPEQCIWLDHLPDGWVIRFGEEMCKELKEILVKADFLEEYKISQVKSKFGGLRWYDNMSYSNVEYREWSDKYEELSELTCELCGKPAKWQTMGWIMSLCDKCKNELNDDYPQKFYELKVTA